jgi:glycosyltransferase involved in cell wall biosynthesis
LVCAEPFPSLATKPRLRIAMLCWESRYSIAVGGVAEHVSQLAAALERRGHDVHVFTRGKRGQRASEWMHGVRYHRCYVPPQAGFLAETERLNVALLSRLQLEERQSGPFDVVHAHDWLAVRALVEARNRFGRTAVLTLHSTEYGRCGNQLHEGDSRHIRDIEWEGSYVAQRVICVSDALRREVQSIYSTPADKMHVIYNGVDVHRFDGPVDVRRVRRRCDVGRDDPLVVFAGRITWQKGPDLLLDAVPETLRIEPRTRFLFAGDGDMRQGLQQRAARSGLGSATRFLGHCKGGEIVRLFKSADVVCVPSRNEPFGIVILEAWSATKPVVATRNGGPAEFVRDGETGVSVCDEAGSIAAGLSTALRDREYSGRLGRNGRQEAEVRFAWDAIAAETEAVYRCLVAKSPPDATRNGAAIKEQIRRRAHQIYAARRYASGDALADWLQAERELRRS